MSQPADFFLSEIKGDDLRFVPPPRQGSVRVLIDGAEAFSAIEEAVAAATRSVFLASWVFDPQFPVQSRKTQAGGATQWTSLLVAAARRGVDVRLLLTDFDPIIKIDLHEEAWRNYRHFTDAKDRLNASVRDNLRVLATRHDAATIGGVLGSLSSLMGDSPVVTLLRRQLTKQLASLNASHKTNAVRTRKRFANLPGLWPLVSYQPQNRTVPFQVRKDATFEAYPASHHQKLCVIDDAVVFCGGLDPKKGRLDSQSHSGSGWHDVHLHVTGNAAADAARAFLGRWTREEVLTRQRIENANRAISPDVTPLPELPRVFSRPSRPSPSPLPEKPVPDDRKSRTASTYLVQSHRTQTVNGSGVLPKVLRNDIELAYQKAISLAESFIYFENQYLRAPDLADWIIARARKSPGLQVICVLPVAPEEAAEKGGPDEATSHGLYLQNQALLALQRALRVNFGVFSMLQRTGGKANAPTRLFGSEQIYVHSKLLLIDDVYAFAGSANATLRSFRVDSEFNIAWADKQACLAARLRLWKELLGGPRDLADWKPKQFVMQWNTIASTNEKAVASQRKGFIVRHDPTHPHHPILRGQPSLLLPDEFA